ncbi:tripartite motif-containing protein 16-like [Gouania willdenowi]|uniref:Tripartite motif-containing protein 16-like n=1 Tax=Gouania willdenowi TaxID=441366 RepID=A0A8C5HGZ0_GOUWI|nr:tripartite motif-containing protein 16-like [Gouania willdenowi]
MAERGVQLQLQSESFSCPICLELLMEPVAIPCGHSYCRRCISKHWDGENERIMYSCPQCRETFTPRPVLMKNTMLAELVEELKKSRLQEAAGDPSFAAGGDVACDFCTGRKRKAFKSCLNCVASYCEKHLQPHHEVTPLKRHKLVDPSEKLQETICFRHDEVMKMFCRTDQQCICILCSMEEHKGHDIVSAAAESSERQKELQESRAEIQKNIQDREKDMDMLEQQLKSIQLSADQTVHTNEQLFTEMIRLFHRKSSNLEKEVRSKQQVEVRVVRVLQEKLEQEVSELKKRDAELQQLSTTEDHVQFVHSYSSLSALSVSTHTPIVLTAPVSCFQQVTSAVSELRDHLHFILTEDRTKAGETAENVDDLEPTNRAGFLQYSQEITLDPNTAYKELTLSDGNRKVTHTNEDHQPTDHPDQFTVWDQVLSRQSLTGRCYLEVEWRGRGVCVAIAYKSITRDGWGRECGFGSNDKSWTLQCLQNSFTFFHNNISIDLSGPHSFRVGVYVDHAAGVLSFYSVCDTSTLLHRVNTTFTEPLHLGVALYYIGDVVELCKL